MSTRIELPKRKITWAYQSAKASFQRWADQPGFYNNRFNSHFKGKLGELTVEMLLEESKIKYISHFRHPEREALCDIEIDTSNQIMPSRIEIKTWSSRHWKSLGRCISVYQFPILVEKADCIFWCVVQPLGSLDPNVISTLDSITLEIHGWSTIEDVRTAPIRNTGHGGMRKVKNYQLDPDKLNPVNSYFSR